MNYWEPHPSSDDKETTHVVVCLRVLHKSSYKALSRRDPAGTAKKVRNVQKKCAARAKLLFCLINLSWPIPFFAISLLSPLVECSLILSLASSVQSSWIPFIICVVINWMIYGLSGKQHNFKKYSSSQINSLDTPYDYESVMHYGAKYFSKNNLPTIVPKQTGVSIKY